MMNAICESLNIKGFLRSLTCPPILRECVEIMENELQSFGFRALQELSLMKSETKKWIVNDWRTAMAINEDLRWAFADIADQMADKPAWSMPSKVVRHRHHSIQNLQFTEFTTSRTESHIFFNLEGNLVPEKISSIISVEISWGGECIKLYFFAIQKFLPHCKANDVFANFPNLGISLWSKDVEEKCILLHDSHCIYHSIYRMWDAETIIFKVLNKVRSNDKDLYTHIKGFCIRRFETLWKMQIHSYLSSSYSPPLMPLITSLLLYITNLADPIFRIPL